MDTFSSPTPQHLAARITRAASHQTYYTVRFLVDRDRRPCAYQAYAYFRWLDDCIDNQLIDNIERMEFLRKQKMLMDSLYRGESLAPITAQENLLVELIRCDSEHDSGLESYIRNMMEVMAFDCSRRGRCVSQHELSLYTRRLATAVTDALHTFIGHDSPAPRDGRRYFCAAAAHITHMLRDTVQDVAAGYYNIPEAYLRRNALDPHDIGSPAYRFWVRQRVELARRYFQAGKEYLARVTDLRCRLAGYAYIARFERLLETFQREEYQLRSHYEDLYRPFDMAVVSVSSLLQALFHRSPDSRLRRSPVP